LPVTSGRAPGFSRARGAPARCDGAHSPPPAACLG